jgi:hypothetical protein
MATVITSMLSAIPWIGAPLTESDQNRELSTGRKRDSFMSPLRTNTLVSIAETAKRDDNLLSPLSIGY